MLTIVTSFTGTRLKRALTAIGSLLALLGVAYVGHRLYMLSAGQDMFRPELLAVLLVAATAYSTALVLLTYAWKAVLRYVDIHPEHTWLFLSYSDYQIAKYIPGNIFNIIGRQVHGAQRGYGMKPIAMSTTLELAGMVLCGGGFWLILIAYQLEWLPSLSLAAISILVFTTASLILFRYAAPLLTALMMQAAFLCISGLIFTFILWRTVGDFHLDASSIIRSVATFNAAWLVGVVTPGAPAGVGIRDGLLLSWMSTAVNSHQLAIAVVLSRISTALGDLFFWLAVRGIFRHA